VSDWNTGVINEFRSNNGAVGGAFAGAHLLLLTTTGAKSGQPRTSPMMYFPDGDRRLVIASKAGADTHPAWYHNLIANAEVHVEASTIAGIEEYDAVATVLPREERDVVFAELSQRAHGFAAYQEKTDRVIPVVALTRRD
jgi:deazaflavin-dependent oxidoreductase (nitroreductase family)